ncbi:tripartite tricarboxylate transporter substrate binding protein [Clostridium sp. KNHs216]|uniref:tripartite tricarboxylate transporter substrate binding protein n=1 Tax=Clostridium sp. KNHs216 TaxID=1550235 RepID=UPI00114D6F1A|nr:tripartite tricarboxylate transporter substrate binding protein [Clostridium sp. KNHs216]TQI68375.1 tripartite-type tricarboxylate transporter receptor subunit TctC [Clostridium sp. KNHs216]
MLSIKKAVCGLLAVALMATPLLGGCQSQPKSQSGGGVNSTAADSKTTENSDYPKKTITLINQFAAGGSSDVLGRALASVVNKYIGATVMVENRPGGSGTIGTDYVLKSKPDGYTLLITSSGNFTTTPIVQGAPYDPVKDVKHIIGIESLPMAIVVNADSQWKTLEDLVNYCKENPGKLKAGAGVPGGTNHMAWQRFTKTAGIKTNEIPFGGGTSEATTSLLGNHIDASVLHPTEISEQLKGGKLRMLAIFSDEKLVDYPDVPTAKECGYDVVVQVNKGISGPAGLPDDIVQKIHDAFKQTMEDPEFIKIVQKTGDYNYLKYETGDELKTDLDKMRDDFSPLLKELGLEKKK